jgi:hypothetical protein
MRRTQSGSSRLPREQRNWSDEEKLADILEDISAMRSSLTAIFFMLLDPTNSMFTMQQDQFYSENGRRVYELLNLLCEDERGREYMSRWISSTEAGKDVVAEAVQTEMDMVSSCTHFKSNKMVDVQYLDQWDLRDNQPDAPFLHHILTNAAETPLQAQRNTKKSPDVVSQCAQ